MDIAPNINVAQVATTRISRKFIKDFDWRSALARDARAAYKSATKSLDIPALLADALRTMLKGDVSVGVEHHILNDAGSYLHKAVTRLCAATLCAAMLLAAALNTIGEPVLWGMTWFSIAMIAGALIMLYCIFFTDEHG